MLCRGVSVNRPPNLENPGKFPVLLNARSVIDGTVEARGGYTNLVTGSELTEAITKLQPNRTVYLRGTNRTGAMGTLHSTSAAGMTISGVFRDQADFSVLVIADADDFFGDWQTTKYLASFDYSGIVLEFDIAYENLFPIDSYKFASFNQDVLSVIREDSTTAFINLAGLATTATGQTAANELFTINSTSTPQQFDRVQLIYLNNVFDFIVPFPNTNYVPSFFALGIGNAHNITINAVVYNFVETAGMSSAQLATAIANVINSSNAGAGDPNYLATPSTNTVICSPKNSTGLSIAFTASDGNAGATKWATNLPLYTVANELVTQINAYNWTVPNPSIAIRTEILPSPTPSFRVFASRFGLVNVAGRVVTFVSGENFLGMAVGDIIRANGVVTEVQSIASPISLVTVDALGTAGGVLYTANGGGVDGNGIDVYELHKTDTCYITPSLSTQLAGGQSATSLHLSIDFTTLGIDSIRQAWLTFAPALNYDSTPGQPSLAAYEDEEWSAVFTNWQLTDPSNNLQLQISGPGSARSASQDSTGITYAGTWARLAGFYDTGYAERTATQLDRVTIVYDFPEVHDLYLGTSLFTDRGIVEVIIDGTPFPDFDCYLNVTSELTTRRLLYANAPAGPHTVSLTVATVNNPSSTGDVFIFDFLEQSIASNPTTSPAVQTNRNAATDWDTQHGYNLSPERLIWTMQFAGFGGDWNHYVGVFWWNQRTRNGGRFHQATATFTGVFDSGTGVGDGDQIFLIIGGDSIGKTVYPADTNTTIAQHFCDFINSVFVGVRATFLANVVTIITISPINGFTFAKSFTPSGGSTGVVTLAGDIDAGNEGTWEIDSTVSPVLNAAATGWHRGFFVGLRQAALTATVAFSQELLNPPDANTAVGAWIQRFYDGTTVLTATGFGTEGLGYVEGIAGSTVSMQGHGYSTGFTVNTNSSTWRITVTDANHFVLTTLLSGAGTLPSIGNSVTANLQTAHCALSPVVATYIGTARAEMANLMLAAGIPPVIQYGEILHWFFSSVAAPIASLANAGGLVRVNTTAAHGFSTGDQVIVPIFLAGVVLQFNAWTITVVNSTAFTLNASVFNASYTFGTAAVGGSMALYDANQAAAAVIALGRSLVLFTCQDSNPSVNSFADAQFLRTRLFQFVEAQSIIVEAACPKAKFEVLFPGDVNNPNPYFTTAVSFPQGGRLNNYINLPLQWSTAGLSSLDRFKTECLSWGNTYSYQAGWQYTINWPTTLLSWALKDTKHLVAWDNGTSGANWPVEYAYAITKNIPEILFWAFDQLNLLSWPLPLPDAAPTPVPGEVTGGLPDLNVHTLRDLNDYAPESIANLTLVIGAGTNLYTTDTGIGGTATHRDSGYSGHPLTTVQFRPDTSPQSWLYIGDSLKMRKINVAGLNYEVGIAPPNVPPTAEIGEIWTGVIDDYQATTGWAAAGTAGAITAVERPPATTTIVAIQYDNATTHVGMAWAVLSNPTTNYAFLGEFARFLFAAEECPVSEVHPGFGSTTILGIQYDNYPSGLCTVTLTNSLPNLNRNSGLLFNGTEYVRVLSVTYSPDGSTYSFRCSNTGFAAGTTVVGVPAIRFYSATQKVVTDTVTGKSITSAVTVGTGTLTKTAALDLSKIGSFGPSSPSDYIHISVMVDDPTKVTSGKFALDVDATTQDFAHNYYEYTFAGDALSTGYWGEIRIPMSSLTRFGTDLTRTLANVAKIRFTLVTTATVQLNIDSWSIDGGWQPDVAGDEINGYVYRFRYRSADTGAKSLPSPATRYALRPSRQSVSLTFIPSADPQVTTIDIERFGGANTGFHYIGSVASNPLATPSFVDNFNDLTIAANAPLETDTFQPFPIQDLPRTGICTVIGTDLTRVSGHTFNVAWAPGIAILINGIANTLYSSPTSFANVILTFSGGTAINVPFSIVSPTLLGQPLPAIWGPLGGQEAAYSFGCGDLLNPGLVYIFRGNDMDSAPEVNNIEVTSPSEPTVNGVLFNQQSYVFSTQRLFELRPSPGGTNLFVPLETPCGVGLLYRWALTTGGGFIWFLGPDGIYQTNGSAAKNISDADLYPLFPHDSTAPASVTIGSFVYFPVNLTEEFTPFLRLNYYNGWLQFDYIDTAGARTTLNYHVATESWWPDRYADPIQVHYTVEGTNESENKLIAGTSTGRIVELGRAEPSDNGTDVQTVVYTPSFDAGETRAQKLFGDFVLDAAFGDRLSCTPYANNYQTALTPSVQPPVSTSVPLVESQLIVDLSSGIGALYRNLGLALEWTSDELIRLFEWIPSFITKPEQSILRATDWDTAGRVGLKYVRGVKIWADTFNISRTAQVQYDTGTVALTLTGIQHNGESLVTYPFPAPFGAEMVRLLPTDIDAWRVWHVEWIYDNYPELKALITEWNDGGFAGRKYVRGLILKADTRNVSLTNIAIQGDGESAAANLATVQHNGLTSKPYAFSTPFLAHNMRFVPPSGQNISIWDQGTEWIYDKYPEFAALITKWTNAGHPGAKWVQGIRLCADSANVAVSVAVQIDGGSNPVTISATHSGKQTLPYSWPGFVAHDLRLVPGGSISIFDEPETQWVWEPMPELAQYWQTQSTTHDLTGWQFIQCGYFAYISSVAVTLTITPDVGTAIVISLPSTSGVYAKTYFRMPPNKFRSCVYYVQAATISGVRVFIKDCEIRVKAWGSDKPFEIKNPFGDLSRSSGATI